MSIRSGSPKAYWVVSPLARLASRCNAFNLARRLVRFATEFTTAVAFTSLVAVSFTTAVAFTTVVAVALTTIVTVDLMAVALGMCVH